MYVLIRSDIVCNCTFTSEKISVIINSYIFYREKSYLNWSKMKFINFQLITQWWKHQSTKIFLGKNILNFPQLTQNSHTLCFEHKKLQVFNSNLLRKRKTLAESITVNLKVVNICMLSNTCLACVRPWVKSRPPIRKNNGPGT